MRYLWIFLFLLCTSANAQTVSSFTHICDVLEGQKGAAYVPGVDIKGKPVVAADLESDFNKEIFPIEIPVEVDLVDRSNLDVVEGLDLEPIIANLTIHEDGRVMYGEQEFTNETQALCETITIEIAPAMEKEDIKKDE